VSARRLPTLLPRDPAARRALRLDAIRILVVVNLVLGTWYITWRWTSSINWAAWAIAVPLVVAETYSWIDSWLFGLTMWKLRERDPPPPPPEDATVDVFITVYNEPLELVRATVRGAREMTYPHRTYVLDDGASPEMQEMTREEGVGYVTRTADWKDRPRHAKAGNLNNALFQTSGEFLLILDADQIPGPQMLDKVLGWFRDERVALVQTPQYFVNVPDDDPMGSQAPLFYGPIQQGKDGWNAAFFCGSNAVLRREALMQLGIIGYVQGVEQATRRVLRTAGKVLDQARREARARDVPEQTRALDALEVALEHVRDARAKGGTLQEATHGFRREVDAISREMVSGDIAAMAADLEELGAGIIDTDLETGLPLIDDAALTQLAARELSPLAAIASVRRLIESLDAVRSDEAQPIMPLATISVTEDMATAMRLHRNGWRSVYHHEVLVHGLAPEDLQSMLQQRLRWAQGTIQVFLRENPIVQRGLSAGQRLMYFATAWSYLSGFAAVAYLSAPVVYLTLGILPVSTIGADFMWHLVPFLLANQLLFTVVGWKVKTFRGMQYSLALFPLWIRAVISTIKTEVSGESLGFVETPKTRQTGASLRLVKIQVWTMGLLVASVVIGCVRLMVGQTDDGGAIALNIAWAAYDLVMLSAVLDAAFYQGFEAQATPAPTAGVGPAVSEPA
jgi:cellulose synthase (UDP-forming)